MLVCRLSRGGRCGQETTASTSVRAQVRFTLFAVGGSIAIATATSMRVTVPAVGTGTITAVSTLTPRPGAVTQWTTKHPQLYTMLAEVLADTAGSGHGHMLDSVNATVGFRATTFSGADGSPPFTLNGEPMHFRGFSHHNSIGGLGVAIPERVQLFRVQASRAMGSNMWRMSHNPYDKALYDLLDATGQMCWDENRDYGAKYGSGVYAVAMRDMVKRDRNHASVIMWSFCNEAECTQDDSDYSGLIFREAAKSIDPTRPVTANGALSQTPTAQLDIQGGSHWGNSTFNTSHSRNATLPQVLSECCSCTSRRDDRNIQASCISGQNSPGKLSYVTGSLGVWTLMDYFGEPSGQPVAWPHVSCDFGNFDIAGFPKPNAYWYAANWLQGAYAADPGRPPLPFKTVVRILNLPAAPQTASDASAGNTSSTATNSTASSCTGRHPPSNLTSARVRGSFSALTTAPFAELVLDGVGQGVLPTPRNARGEVQPTQWSVHLPPPRYSSRGCGGGGGSGGGGSCTGTASFPTNASGVQCHDLHRSTEGDNSANACAQMCCAEHGCNTWQLETSDHDVCWIGRAGEGIGKCGPPRQGTWVGGQRTTPPGPPGPPAPPTPPAPPFHNATLVAYSADPGRGSEAAAATNTVLGTAKAIVLATHSLFAPSSDPRGHRLQLLLDVPSASTGTGTALLLDGRDVAMVRCAVVDSHANDALVSTAADRITWTVSRGAGRLAGTASGNTSSHEWMKSHSVNAYLGLARGMFRVTQDCTSPARASCVRPFL